MVSITRKTVLVTGTNRGIGHAPAAEALARGAGRAAAGAQARLPWIPGQAEWLQVLGVFRAVVVRNRELLVLAYDAAPCREESCSLAPMTLTRRTGSCGCGRRRPRPAGSRR